MKTTTLLTAASLALMLSASAARAQTSVDAARLATQDRGVGSRALGMGNAFIGVSDDFTATYWNPAGLAQMRRIEITGGITNFHYKNSASFMDATTDDSKSATKLDNIGFAFPFPTRQGSFVVAFGYNRASDYTTALSFNGFNPNSSIIPSLYESDEYYDVPFKVYLENSNGYTPITRNVNQSAVVKETGGLGNWSFAAAIDVAKDVSFGVTLNVLSGSYTYQRNYLEEDTRNVYANTQAQLPADSAYLRFNKFYYDSDIEDDISGVNALFGMMYRSDRFRFGLTIKTPSAVKVSETYTDAGQSIFDANYNPGATQYSYTADNEYGITSPWTFGAGVSVEPLDGLILAGDIDYADWTEIEWTNNKDLEKLNTDLAKQYRGVTNLRLGAEYEIPSIGVRLRGGYMINPSPFAGDPSSFDVKTVTAGAGVLLQNNVLLDLGVALGSFNTFHTAYQDQLFPPRTYESVDTRRVNFSVSYRF